MIVIGLVLAYARAGFVWKAKGDGAQAGNGRQSRRPYGSIVRSWIALSLIAGLLLYFGLAFAVDGPTLRSTLAGAVGAAVGSTTAYYFSSIEGDGTGPPTARGDCWHRDRSAIGA
ncbi:hypothetical protein [Streptacidiphilus jiangxiensis]|uniref:hypothetical protein n=1 Tax=Streptacidiphilus jiangxiensis TaxID=235985 RepID=UPI001160CB51|nr:hypothetical protein [Streptacidiphilus jiangxiensis]